MRTRDLVLFIGVFLLLSVLLSVLLIAAGDYVYWLTPEITVIISQLLSYVFSFVLVPKVYRHIKEDINMKALLQLKSYGYVCFGLISLLVLYFIFYRNTVLETGLGAQFSVWIFILLIVVLPSFEEILFRGILQKFLLDRKGNIISIAVPSILFALMHDRDFLYYLGFGIILGVIKSRTNSIMCTYVCHALWNGITLILII